MAAKKSIETLIKEVEDNITALSNKYVALMLDEPDDKDVEKIKEDKKELTSRLAALKKDLKFLQGMKGGKIDKKKERELQKQQDDIINWVKKMPSSISDIVKTIPKS